MEIMPPHQPQIGTFPARGKRQIYILKRGQWLGGLMAEFAVAPNKPQEGKSGRKNAAADFFKRKIEATGRIWSLGADRVFDFVAHYPKAERLALYLVVPAAISISSLSCGSGSDITLSDEKNLNFTRDRKLSEYSAKILVYNEGGVLDSLKMREHETVDLMLDWSSIDQAGGQLSFTLDSVRTTTAPITAYVTVEDYAGKTSYSLAIGRRLKTTFFEKDVKNEEMEYGSVGDNSNGALLFKGLGGWRGEKNPLGGGKETGQK
jgi:hypothetical protein